MLARMRAVLAIELALICLAVVLLVRVAVRRRAFDRVGTVLMPPPWRGRDGVRVLIWGGALGVQPARRALSRVLVRARSALLAYA